MARIPNILSLLLLYKMYGTFPTPLLAFRESKLQLERTPADTSTLRKSSEMSRFLHKPLSVASVESCSHHSESDLRGFIHTVTEYTWWEDCLADERVTEDQLYSSNAASFVYSHNTL